MQVLQASMEIQKRFQLKKMQNLIPLIHMLKLNLIQKNYSGLFHSTPSLSISRYDFSIQLAKSLDLDSRLINPILNKKLGRNVETGKNKSLDGSKIVQETNFEFLTLEKSFELLKKQIENDSFIFEY